MSAWGWRICGARRNRGQGMTIEIKFSEADDVLVARLTGLFTPRADELTDRSIAQKCIESNKTKVLIDYRLVDGEPSHWIPFIPVMS